MNIEKLKSTIEALLFVAQKPLKTSKIFSILAEETLSIDLVKELLLQIQEEKKKDSSGIYLANVAGAWQFRTKEEHARYIKKLDGVKTLKLSNAAMEVLAIIAYNQPATKAFVQEIRGVESSHIFKQLLDKGFIRIDGRAKNITGNPLQYATTKFFLEYFGINDLSQLPSLKETVDMITAGVDTDVKIDFMKNLEQITPLDLKDDELLNEHDKLINELARTLKNGKV